MSATAMRNLFAIVLIVHGVGHGLGVLSVFGMKLSRTHTASSWLLSPVLGDAATRGVAFVLWLLAALGFIAAGLAHFGWFFPQSAWQALALAATVVSCVALILFWYGLPLLFPHRIGAVAVNAAVIVYLVLLRRGGAVGAG